MKEVPHLFMDCHGGFTLTQFGFKALGLFKSVFYIVKSNGGPILRSCEGCYSLWMGLDFSLKGSLKRKISWADLLRLINGRTLFMDFRKLEHNTDYIG